MKPSVTTADNLADRVDALLPQTQCRQCGYDGCRPYAEAVAAGRADINRCPPGGDETIRALARITRSAAKPLDPACGAVQPPAIAVIEEPVCIGCTLCILACPVDAIVGASKRMHTVIAQECTGCGLCVPPCPVNCITLVETVEIATPEERRLRAAHYKQRHAARRARLAREHTERLQAGAEISRERRKQAAVERAMQRARERLRLPGKA